MGPGHRWAVTEGWGWGVITKPWGATEERVVSRRGTWAQAFQQVFAGCSAGQSRAMTRSRVRPGGGTASGGAGPKGQGARANCRRKGIHAPNCHRHRQCSGPPSADLAKHLSWAWSCELLKKHQPVRGGKPRLRGAIPLARTESRGWLRTLRRCGWDRPCGRWWLRRLAFARGPHPLQGTNIGAKTVLSVQSPQEATWREGLFPTALRECTGPAIRSVRQGQGAPSPVLRAWDPGQRQDRFSAHRCSPGRRKTELGLQPGKVWIPIYAPHLLPRCHY